MKREDIYAGLVAKKFDRGTAEILSESLITVNPELLTLLKSWLESGVETDYKTHGITIKRLMEEHGMQYQAALLTIDWILKEPDIALNVLRKGIR